MEGPRFDHLSRRFAGARTRRQVLKTIAGAVIATVAGTRATAAQECMAHYAPCAGDDQCCAGAVCEYGLCMPGCRIDGIFVTAWMSPPENICEQCIPELSTTTWTPANEGTSCWSGDPNAGVTTCQSGVCAGSGTGPVDCRPQTVCHTAAVNPATGQCEQGFAPAGTECGTPAICHGGFFQPADTCDGAGLCIGGGSQVVSCAPYTCGEGTCATSCAGDADCAEGAHCDDGHCFHDLGPGEPCDEDRECLSGVCAGGFCCDRRCDSLCETCSTETGGRCLPVSCDDGLSCTSDACDERTGECVSTLDPGFCAIEGACYPMGAANPANGCLVCDPDRQTGEWSVGACADGGTCIDGSCTSTINGELIIDTPTIDSCQFGPEGPVHAHFYQLTHPGGPLRIGMTGGINVWERPFPHLDPHLDLYSTFDPGQPCANQIASNDDGGCLRGDAYLHVPDLAPGVYTLVARGFLPTFLTASRGPYTLTFGQGLTC